MAAPIKQGLEFFPYEIGLLQDKKLRRLKLRYGAIVAVIYLALLEMIYSGKGYYLEYEECKEDVIWEVQEYLQGKFLPEAETVSDVIDGLAESGLFSGGCYPKIITSKRVQATFYKATVARKAVDVDFDIWLLNQEEMEAISAKSLILQKFINHTNNGVNRPNNGVNRPIYEHIEKEREKEIEIETKARTHTCTRKAQGTPSLDDVKEFFKAKGLTLDPQRFYSFNVARGWVDKNGNAIGDWKELALAWQATEPKLIKTHTYTEEQLNALVDDIDEVTF